MDNQKYFTAGEFAKLHKISKQALLFYDKIGLLSPSYVEVQNGYRYYDSTQLELLDTISILKEIGVSLKEIKGYLSSRSNQQAIEMLRQRKCQLEEKMQEQARICKRLEGKLTILQQAQRVEGEEGVRYVEEPPQFLYTEAVQPPYQLLETDLAIKRLLQALTREKIAYNYQTGVMIPQENLYTERFLEAEQVFSLLEKPVDAAAFFLRPGGLYGVFYHRGSYRDAGKTYRHALAQMKREGYRICSGSFEECMIDNLATGRESEYLTKISIRVD